ncbi:hypothetical protein [Rubripirellula tenax]|nr:hypothetical protein [Rubripirellula tenax]
MTGQPSARWVTRLSATVVEHEDRWNNIANQGDSREGISVG